MSKQFHGLASLGPLRKNTENCTAILNEILHHRPVNTFFCFQPIKFRPFQISQSEFRNSILCYALLLLRIFFTKNLVMSYYIIVHLFLLLLI